MSALNDIKVAVGVVEGYLETADKKAYYWATEIGIDLDMANAEKPGDLSRQFLKLVRPSLEG